MGGCALLSLGSANTGLRLQAQEPADVAAVVAAPLISRAVLPRVSYRLSTTLLGVCLAGLAQADFKPSWSERPALF